MIWNDEPFPTNTNRYHIGGFYDCPHCRKPLFIFTRVKRDDTTMYHKLILEPVTASIRDKYRNSGRLSPKLEKIKNG